MTETIFKLSLVKKRKRKRKKEFVTLLLETPKVYPNALAAARSMGSDGFVFLSITGPFWHLPGLVLS